MPPPSPEISVGLSIFGSLVTEMAPPDLPEGVSPDNQDIVYYPGGVQSRPGLQRLYAIGRLPANVTITYLRTYVQPNGVPLNIIVDSAGNVWSENVTVTPGVLTQIGNVAAGSYCSSTTAFGREYLAFHNNKNGTDIPRQFDGTFFDRVSQDGPGAGPTVADLVPSILNVVSLTPRGALTIASVIETGLLITVTTTTAHGLFVNDQVLVNTGQSVIDNRGQPIRVEEVASATSFSYQVGVTGQPAQSSGTVTPLAITLVTSAPHGLLTFDSFVIAGTNTAYDNNFNEVINGSATLIDQISELSNSTVAVVVCNVAHGLATGDLITVDTGNGKYDQAGTLFPIIVTSPTTLNYDTGYSGLPALTAGVGGAPFTVTQRINLNSPPNWTVRTVVNATTLTFTGSSTSGGTIAAMGTFKGGGVSSEGAHQCVVMFQTRQGYITAPSPPITFGSAGNRRFSISNIPLGPPNVIARILAFTGSGGGNFFYVPVTPTGMDVSGARVAIGTSTVIADNTSTTATIDLADNTLFAATAIDIPGNNLFALAPLGPGIGFLGYAERLASWGQANRLLNLLNMGFNGGYLSGAPPLLPGGWDASGVRAGTGALATLGALGPGFGMAWSITSDGSGNNFGLISQPAFQDFNGVPIIKPKTQYTFKCWLQTPNGLPSAGTLFCDLFRPGTGQIAFASVAITGSPAQTDGVFVTADFNVKTPSVIPANTVLRIYAQGTTFGDPLLVQELEIVPSEDPYTYEVSVSYVANPESFDSETGRIANQDPTGIQVAFARYETLHFLSSQGLYRTNDSATGEPDSWTVVEVSGRCGAAGPRACDIGENIAFWVSTPSVSPPTARGLYVYFGGQVYKASQEIQPDFDAVNPEAESSIWLVNDMITRRVYIGLPVGGATAPNLIYPLDYRELDVASDIATRPPVHVSFSGKMVCSDLCRKWTRWNAAANCAAMYMLPNGVVKFALGGGNGQAPGLANGFANGYWLNPAKLTDDDYGTIVPYYVPYFFVNHEMEMALGVGLQRKLYKRWSAFVSGVGNLLLTPYADALANPYPTGPLLPLSSTALVDVGEGLNVSAERLTCKIQSVPLTGQTDNAFNLQKFTLTLKKEPISPIRWGAV